MFPNQYSISWSTDRIQPPTGQLITSDSLLLLSTRGPNRSSQHTTLYSLDLVNGDLRWQKLFERTFISGMVSTFDGMILVSLSSSDFLCNQGRVVALDASGTIRGYWAPNANRVSSPAVTEDVICFTVDTKVLFILDPNTGEELSRVVFEAIASLAAPAVMHDIAYIPCRGPHLLAIGLDGETRWTFTAANSSTWLDKTPIVMEDRLFAVLSTGAALALHREDGSLNWITDVSSVGRSLTTPTTDGDRLYVGARDGLYALALEDGAEVWHFKTPRKIEATPVVHAGVVYTTCHDHHLYALDAISGKELWRYKTGWGIEVSPVLAECAGHPCVIVADGDGVLTAIARPLSALEHETAGNWPQAAAIYVSLGQIARAAQLLEDHGETFPAAELWEKVGELKRAAEQYEVGGNWPRAIELWEQLGQGLRQAQALQAYACSLEEATYSSEDRAAVWAAAAQAYEMEGEVQKAALCQGEAARHLSLPIITLDVEIDKGLVTNAWSQLRFIVRNEGYGVARNLFVRTSGDQFKGQVSQTQQIFTLREGQEKSRLLDVCPQAYGDTVPLRVTVEYEDQAGKSHQCTHTIYIPVAREKAARRQGQTTYNVFVAGGGAAAVGEGAVAAGTHGIAIRGDVKGTITTGEVVPNHQLEQLRLDAAVPEKVFISQSFDLAVAVRQLASPILAEQGLSRLTSGEVQVSWTKVEEHQEIPYVRLRVEVNAPECRILGASSYTFLLYPSQDSSTFYFQLIPQQVGEIGIILVVFREDDCLGSARVRTMVCEQVIGKVEMRVMSYDFSTAGIIWRTAPIRELLAAAFDDEKLTTFCFDYFRTVYENFSARMSKGRKIQELLDYCDRHNQMTQLLSYVQKHNPTQYARFEHLLWNKVAE